MLVDLPHITLADAHNEPLDERLFNDDAPVVRQATPRRVYVDTRTPLGEGSSMAIHVYIEHRNGTFGIYSALTHAMLDTRLFATHQQATQAAHQRGWVIVE